MNCWLFRLSTLGWTRSAATAALLISLSGLTVLAKDPPAATATAPAKKTSPSTTTPAPRDAKWMQRHDLINSRVKDAKGNVDLIFIGDSITHGWEGRGKDVWKEFYGNRKAANLGIGGDQTQHVLWRLQNGNIEGISPKLAVIMIGTNNSGANTPEQIADGVKAIVNELRTKLPKTKILLLDIFPRGVDNNDPKRKVNEKANAIICTLADGEMIMYQDIGPKFLDEKGVLSKDIMPDLLHPNDKGYRIWAEAIEPTIAKIVGPK